MYLLIRVHSREEQPLKNPVISLHDSIESARKAALSIREEVAHQVVEKVKGRIKKIESHLKDLTDDFLRWDRLDSSRTDKSDKTTIGEEYCRLVREEEKLTIAPWYTGEKHCNQVVNGIDMALQALHIEAGYPRVPMVPPDAVEGWVSVLGDVLWITKKEVC